MSTFMPFRGDLVIESLKKECNEANNNALESRRCLFSKIKDKIKAAHLVFFLNLLYLAWPPPSHGFLTFINLTLPGEAIVDVRLHTISLGKGWWCGKCMWILWIQFYLQIVPLTGKYSNSYSLALNLCPDNFKLKLSKNWLYKQ